MAAFDRDKAYRVLMHHCVAGVEDIELALDALAGCVTDDPPTIDRDALCQALYELQGELETADVIDAYADRIVGLLRPAPAPTIDREELNRLYQEWELLALAIPVQEAHQRILALLRPAPAPTIDRDALRAVVLWAMAHVPTPENIDAVTDRILSLLRPDPRIAKLEAWSAAQGPLVQLRSVLEVRAILRGES